MVLLKLELLFLFFLGVILNGVIAGKGVKAVDLLEVKRPEDPLVFAFDNLKEDERSDFLAYFLALGLQNWAESQAKSSLLLSNLKLNTIINDLNLPENKIEKYKRMYIPKESTRKLLKWTQEEFNLSTEDVIELVERKRVGDKPSLPDIGEFCCPW